MCPLEIRSIRNEGINGRCTRGERYCLCSRTEVGHDPRKSVACRNHVEAQYSDPPWQEAILVVDFWRRMHIFRLLRWSGNVRSTALRRRCE